MKPAMVAATHMTKVSLFFTWAISWAITPSSSLSSRTDIIPVVAATTAFLGFLPVAKAFGVEEGTIATLGIGKPFKSAIFFTIPNNLGLSLLSITLAPYALRTIESL